MGKRIKIEKVPKERLFVKLAEGLSKDQREDVINGLRTFFSSDQVQAIDTRTLIDSISVATDLMNLFFQVVGIIAMIMCFFILWLSFTANIMENAWEFGVL